ncbi:MAG: ZIP family metal transporter [Bacilli bacterium]|nr:ZIP family metal transporter [Bacilli bacterium]
MDYNYTLLALYGGLFTWLLTIIGSSSVFAFKKINKNILDISLSLSAGIMLSASIFSLINPAIENSKELKLTPWINVGFGIIAGALFILFNEKIFEKKISNKKTKNIFLMIISITLHNIPEGLAVGIAFGSIKYGINGITITSATLLTLGIGIQNFPEGSAISLPLRRLNYSRLKSFFYGMISAIVEPIFALIGALLTLRLRILMPFLLSFAAGSMIYVIFVELIPESQKNEYKSLMAFSSIIGFVLMMILDITL